MRFSNIEILEAGEEVRDCLKIALDTLAGIEEYKDICNDIQSLIVHIEAVQEPFEEAVRKEEAKEQEYMNNEYERGVL